jgi:hypothetical protein
VSTSKQYQKCIEAIAGGQIDYTRLGVELAKAQPSLFLRLLPKQQPATWIRTAAEYLNEGQFVNAAKTTREGTGLGLEEAKDICDVARGTTGSTLSDSQLVIMEQIRDMRLRLSSRAGSVTRS